jgi:hypothetical protein
VCLGGGGGGRWMSKSCRDVVCRGVGQAHEEAGMEERRLVPGTVVFVVLNFMCYIIKHNTGKKVLSHTSHVSSRPRTRILELRLSLALSLTLSLTLAHHDGSAVRRESSCHRARTPRHPLAGPSLPSRSNVQGEMFLIKSGPGPCHTNWGVSPRDPFWISVFTGYPRHPLVLRLAHWRPSRER